MARHDLYVGCLWRLCMLSIRHFELCSLQFSYSVARSCQFGDLETFAHLHILTPTTNFPFPSIPFIHIVEFQPLCHFFKFQDEIFSEGPRKVNTRIMNSARSSLNEEPVPGKPLTNAWGKPPSNRDKNTRYNHRPTATEHNNDVQRLPRTKQRTFSHADKVEDLRSKLKERQSKNHESKKPLGRCRSVEMLVEKKPNTPQGRGGGSVTDLHVEDIDGGEQMELWSDLDSDRSGSNTLLSREPKIKSDKPATKPILLGECDSFFLQRETIALNMTAEVLVFLENVRGVLVQLKLVFYKQTLTTSFTL